jgi:hypothetical protein
MFSFFKYSILALFNIILNILLYSYISNDYASSVSLFLITEIEGVKEKHMLFDLLNIITPISLMINMLFLILIEYLLNKFFLKIEKFIVLLGITILYQIIISVIWFVY